MDNTKLYYMPPKDSIFNEVRDRSIDIWNTYDDEFGYATEKINGIKDLKNTEGNFMFIVSQFDHWNRAKLAYMLSLEARNHVSIRMEAGGSGELGDVFNIWMKK
jgi:hypothetical protein